MKIQNKYIKIKNGDREIELHNTILKTYLFLLWQMQFVDASFVDSEFVQVYFKFDDEMIVDFESQFEPSDFDANFLKKYVTKTYTGNVATVDYIFDIDKRFLSMWYGHKITAIGFGTLYGIGAVVDTSKYDIYLYDNAELQIFRRDTYITDGLFSSNDGIKGLYHIMQNGDYKWQNNNSKYVGEWGILKSIGLGVSKGVMLEEYNIKNPFEYPDEDVIMSDDMQGFVINKELTVERISEGLFPATDLYPSSSLYPARVIENGLYPSNELYPAIDVYPASTPYQYVILKYEVYEYNGFTDVSPSPTGKYYTISNKIPNNINKFKEQLRYEAVN